MLFYEKYRTVEDGNVATYIPELSNTDPNGFAICLVTVDGQVICVGDWNREFTIQSVCKPFAYQMALKNLGASGRLPLWVSSRVVRRSTRSNWIRGTCGPSTPW